MANNYAAPVGVAVLACASLFPVAGGAVNDLYCTVASSCVTPIPSTIDYVIEERSGKWIKFQNLAKQWRSERGARSSITEAAMLQPYQSIIGMGEDAIRPIILQLKAEGDDPDEWFWALRAITDVNPVSQEDQGDFAKMAQAWIKWAEGNGYAG